MALRNSWKWLIALGAVFVPSSVLGTVTIPYQFSSTGKIDPAQLNGDFAAVKTFVDGLETRINGLQTALNAKADKTQLTAKADKPSAGAFTPTRGGKIAYAMIGAGCFQAALNTSCAANNAFSPTGAAVTVKRTTVGVYEVTLPGVNMPAGNVQVTAVGLTNNWCKAEMWTSSMVRVACYNPRGAVDATFTVLAVY
jgi:hypothetical protein